jgi:predicted nuclease with TOPRIM domain
VDNQALQLHEKVQKLIEQYTIDKKKLTELESKLKDRVKENESLQNNITNLQSELSIVKESNVKLVKEMNEMKQKNLKSEEMISTFESFANDLNSKIDDLIPKIDKL